MSDPMNLVTHIKRSETGLTKMQITLPIGMRASLSEASSRLQMSQLAIIRAAISSWLLDHGGWEAWDRPPIPPNEAPGPEMMSVAVPGPEPLQQIGSPTSQSHENCKVPDPVTVVDTVLESVDRETTVVPDQTPAPKRSRKKGGKL